MSDLVAINVPSRIAVFDDGVGEITNYIDLFGDETTDPDEAFTVIIRCPDGLWMPAAVSDFEPVQRH